MIRTLVLGAVATLLGAAAASATASTTPEPLERAAAIRAEVGARYQQVPGRGLAVSEATTTAVVESFTLLTSDLLAARIVAAANGLYFAICPVRATCPYPARRLARPAADLLPRRLALELAVRTFLETSASVVAVSLPTPRFLLFVVERHELAREVDMPALAQALGGDPAPAPTAWLRRTVDEITRPRVFVVLGLEPTPSGRDTLAAIPRWPSAAPQAQTTYRPQPPARPQRPQSAKALIPWLNQALSMPTERVEHRLPAGLGELDAMDEAQLERLVASGREQRRLQLVDHRRSRFAPGQRRLVALRLARYERRLDFSARHRVTSSVCAIISAVTADELAKAAEVPRAILHAVEHGELAGPPGLVARLEGALTAIEEVVRTSR